MVKRNTDAIPSHSLSICSNITKAPLLTRLLCVRPVLFTLHSPSSPLTSHLCHLSSVTCHLQKIFPAQFQNMPGCIYFYASTCLALCPVHPSRLAITPAGSMAMRCGLAIRRQWPQQCVHGWATLR